MTALHWLAFNRFSALRGGQCRTPLLRARLCHRLSRSTMWTAPTRVTQTSALPPNAAPRCSRCVAHRTRHGIVCQRTGDSVCFWRRVISCDNGAQHRPIAAAERGGRRECAPPPACVQCEVSPANSFALPWSRRMQRKRSSHAQANMLSRLVHQDSRRRTSSQRDLGVRSEYDLEQLIDPRFIDAGSDVPSHRRRLGNSRYW